MIAESIIDEYLARKARSHIVFIGCQDLFGSHDSIMSVDIDPKYKKYTDHLGG